MTEQVTNKPNQKEEKELAATQVEEVPGEDYKERFQKLSKDRIERLKKAFRPSWLQNQLDPSADDQNKK